LGTARAALADHVNLLDTLKAVAEVQAQQIGTARDALLSIAVVPTTTQNAQDGHQDANATQTASDTTVEPTALPEPVADTISDTTEPAEESADRDEVVTAAAALSPTLTDAERRVLDTVVNAIARSDTPLLPEQVFTGTSHQSRADRRVLKRLAQRGVLKTHGIEVQADGSLWGS
jgi:hypothetical protein